MKKLLSLFLTIAVIVATFACAVPMVISAAEAPIEATPLEVIGEPGRNYNFVKKVTTTTPLGFTTAQGLIAMQNDAYAGSNAHESADGAVGNCGRYVSMNYAESILFGTSTSIIIYVKTDAANTIVPSIVLSDNKSVMGKVGFDYQYAAINDIEWTTSQFGTGLTDSNYFGAVSFDGAFEGYLKIPYTSMGNDNNTSYVFNPETDRVSQVVFRFKGLGSNYLATSDSTTVYGSAVVGPVFVVTKDSNSTKINVPAEWQTAPIEATPVVGWTHTGAASITRSEITPLKTVNANGIKVSAATAFDLGDGLAFSSNSYFVAMNFSSYAINDTEGIILYVKTDSANQIAFSLGATNFGYGTANLVEGRSFYTLPNGADSWEAKTITAGHSTDKYLGALKFDEAFEGYVKIPYASLGSSRSTFSVFNNTYSITQFAFRFRALGGDFGGAVVGPVSTYKTDSSSAVIKYPDEFKPQPLNVTPLVWSKYGKAYDYDAVFETPQSISHLIAVNGVKLTENGYGQRDKMGKGYGSNIYVNNDGDTFELPTDFTQKGSVILYVKTDSANELVLMTRTNNGKLTKIKAGGSYEFAGLGDEYWSSATADSNGVISFASAFDGMIKIPASSIVNYDYGSSMTFDKFTYLDVRVGGVGGTFGSVTVGPFFVTTDISSSAQLVIPEEYKPQPLEIKSFDFREVRAAGYNYSTDLIEGTNNYKLYIDENVVSDTPVKHQSGVDKWSYVENEDGKVASGGATPLVMTPTVDTYMKDAIGMVFYVKFTKANKFSPSLNFVDAKGVVRAFMLKPGQSVYLLENGADEWTEKTIDAGHVNSEGVANSLIYGMVSFDTAFEGYIKVPFASCNNDSGFKPTFSGDNMTALTNIAIRFKGIGDDTMYGKEVVVGVTGYYTADTSRPAIGNISTPEYEYGDVNYDWKVDSADLVSARKSLVGYKGHTGYTLTLVDLVKLKKLLTSVN